MSSDDEAKPGRGRPPTGAAKNSKTRVKEFRARRRQEAETLEKQIEAAVRRFENKTVQQLGVEIGAYAQRWGVDHKSVQDRIRALARRSGVL